MFCVKFPLVSIEPTSIVGRIVDNNRLRCVLSPDVGVCVHSYLRPPPAPGAGCRGSAGRAGPQRKPSALRQQRSPPRPSPQSRCSDLQIKTEGRVTCYSVSWQLRSAALFIRKPAPPGQSVWITRIQTPRSSNSSSVCADTWLTFFSSIYL